MNKIGLIIAYYCLIILFGCSSAPEPTLLAGKVTQVVSGQTVEVVLIGSSEATKVRIIGIDAPDLRQSPWGEAAKKKLSELVVGLPVKLELESEERDRYNRLHAHIWQNDLVSQQLVESGCVLANDSYEHKYSKLLMESREYARLMGYGIWNPKLAIRYTPSQFRSLNK